MSGLATIPAASAPSEPKSEPKAAKTRQPTKRIRQAVELLVTGECKTQKAAAARIGIAPETLSRSLREPHVLAWIEKETRVALTRLQAPAAGLMAKLMVDAQSEHVQKDLIIHALAINGHKPASSPQVSVNIDIKAGYVIDLSEPGARPMVDVSPKVLTDHGTGGE